VGGHVGENPFGPSEKEYFVKTLVAQARGEWAVSKLRLTRAYTVELRVAVPLQKLRQWRGCET
jgi:hypothetical protein